MFSARLGRMIAGKVGYTVCCLLAAVLVVVSGYAHKAVADLNALGGGITIGGSSSVGAMNILVMGLESRTNFEGQCLSASLLTAMHAGNVGILQGPDGRLPGHRHADPHPHLRGRAEGGRLLDPPRRPGHLPQGLLRRHHQGKIDQAYYFAYVTSLDSTYRLVHELQGALPAGQ